MKKVMAIWMVMALLCLPVLEEEILRLADKPEKEEDA